MVQKYCFLFTYTIPYNWDFCWYMMLFFVVSYPPIKGDYANMRWQKLRVCCLVFLLGYICQLLPYIQGTLQ